MKGRLGVLAAVMVVGVAAVVIVLARDEPAGPGDGPPRTVFLGDSITRGVSAETHGPSEQESWVTYAVADPRSPWLLESNAGVFGDTLDQMWNRFEIEVLEPDPDAVVIMGGTNDVLQGVATEESLAAVRQMVEAARAAGIEVWLVAPPPIDDGYARSIAPLVDAERELAAELGVPFADPADALAGPAGGWSPGLSFDGVHPNLDGARALADAVLDDLDG
ncbi:MAG: GDSL-type esterase/lipase family protein [Nocardioides sp.]